RRSPHTRGDGPRHAWRLMPPMSFSPHAWGWSVTMPVDVGRISVLPTRVGMVRTCGGLSAATLSSPHTRGDGPITASTDGGPATFSPHAWGWSGNRKVSRDSVVKKAPEEEFVNLVKQTYRVLLTRGMKGCYVYFEDAGTKEFFLSRMNAERASAVIGA